MHWVLQLLMAALIFVDKADSVAVTPVETKDEPPQDLIPLIASIRAQGPRLFNSLNSEICNAANISLFKSKLQTFLLS